LTLRAPLGYRRADGLMEGTERVAFPTISTPQAILETLR
jgi:hypothetical protein